MLLKYVLFVLFCMFSCYSRDSFSEACEVPVAKVVFYDLGKKVFIPSFVVPLSFRYLDLYCGCSFGYNVWFVNKNWFKFGLVSARIDVLNVLIDWITFYKKCDVAKFRIATNIGPWCGEALGTALSNNIIVCIVNMKFGPFVVHFLEINTLIFAELASCGCVGNRGGGGYDKYDDYRRRLRNYCIFNALLPSLQIDALYVVNYFKKRFRISIS